MIDFTPLTKPIKSKPFLVLDIESKDDDTDKAGFTRPFMLGVYGGTNYVPFFDTNKSEGYPWQERYFRPGGCIDLAMRRILTPRYRGFHIYAHNAGRFDYLFILPWLMQVGADLGFEFNIIPVSSSIQVLDVKMGFDRWRFLDSYKLLPTSLDKAAKTFGIGVKYQLDLDLPESSPEWVERNKADCVQLYQILTKFHHYIENVLGSEVGITAPSTSIKLLRRKYVQKALPRSTETHDFVRSGYFGGRVEVFKKEGWGLHYYDINSSYPRAMLEDMPGGPATEWLGEPPKRIRDNRIGFVEADIDVPTSIHIPPLPLRMPSGKDNASIRNGAPDTKLIFPVGHLRGVWEWDELRMALEQGCRIREWYRSVWYEPVSIFRGFVEELYSYRDKNSPNYDVGLAEIAKLMLNSAYGKFGMRTLRKKIYRWDDPNLPDNAVPASSEPDSPIWYAEEEVDAPYIMPQIAARVTALARCRLYRGMLSAIQRGGTVYYCDTDSIITDVALDSSTKLGEWKDEGADWAKSLDEELKKRGFEPHGWDTLSGRLHGEFIGPKLYMLEIQNVDPKGKKWEKVKAKGLQDRTRSTVESLARGERVYQKRLEKIGSLAKAGFMRGPRMQNVPRRLLLDQGKRHILDNGETKPYTVRMW